MSVGHDLVFEPLTRPVRVTGRGGAVEALVAGLVAVLLGWPRRVSASGAPLCRVTAGPAGYTVASDYLPMPLGPLPLTSALCSVVADLAEAYIEAHPGMRGLHCGAVRIGGRLVLLAGRGHSGKSTLVARLGAMPGVEVFCDDVLPIRPDGMAVGLGVAPWVRLPLPDTASDAFRSAVAATTGPRDADCAYVPSGALVPHGTLRRPAALLVLQRRSGVAPRLHALPAAEAAAVLLAQDVSLQADGLAQIERVAEMAETMLCATFVYDDLEAAAEMLCAMFGAATLEGVALHAPLKPVPPDRSHVAPADLLARWKRNRDVGLRLRHGAAFLWEPRTGRYFHLNRVALTCWHLIEGPMTGTEIVEDLTALFPDASAQQIRRDVASWLADMAANGLLQRA